MPTSGGTTGTPSSALLGFDEGAVTLSKIERETARRCGPFALTSILAAPAPTTSVFALAGLQSNIDLGGFTDMFLLRRGKLTTGVAVTPFVATDRVRTIRAYNPSSGTIEVDAIYTNAPVSGEQIEIHHLHPEQELRPSVLAGLRRCWMIDRATLNLVGTGPEYDLTAQVPWLLSPEQVYRVEYGLAGSSTSPVRFWRAFSTAGSVYLSSQLAPGNTVVTARRAAATYVKPEGQPEFVARAGHVEEPWQDEDEFIVPLDYACAAAHIELWRRVRYRLAPVAQTGFYADQKEAAAEFTRVAKAHFDPPRPMQGLMGAFPDWNYDLTN